MVLLQKIKSWKHNNTFTQSHCLYRFCPRNVVASLFSTRVYGRVNQVRPNHNTASASLTSFLSSNLTCTCIMLRHYEMGVSYQMIVAIRVRYRRDVFIFEIRSRGSLVRYQAAIKLFGFSNDLRVLWLCRACSADGHSIFSYFPHWLFTVIHALCGKYFPPIIIIISHNVYGGVEYQYL